MSTHDSVQLEPAAHITRRATMPTKHRSSTIHTQSRSLSQHQHSPTATIISPQESESSAPPFSAIGTTAATPDGTAYQYFHIPRHVTDSAEVSPVSPQSPSADPSIVAVHGSAITDHPVNKEKHGDIDSAFADEAGKRLANGNQSRLPSQPINDMVQEQEIAVKEDRVPGCPEVAKNERPIRLAFDTISKLPDAESTFPSAIISLQTLGHPVEIIADDRAAAEPWLEGAGISESKADTPSVGKVKFIGVDDEVVSGLVISTSVEKQPGQSAPSFKLIEITGDSASAINRGFDAGKPLEEIAAAPVKLKDWEAVIDWVMKWDKAAVNTE